MQHCTVSSGTENFFTLVGLLTNVYGSLYKLSVESPVSIERFLPPPRRLCNARRLSVCLLTILYVKLLNLCTYTYVDFMKILPLNTDVSLEDRTGQCHPGGQDQILEVIRIQEFF